MTPPSGPASADPSPASKTPFSGNEVFYPAGTAEIVIGPLLRDRYHIFTPGHLGHARIQELTEGFAPDPLRYDLILEIEDMTYPPALLGRRYLDQDFWLAGSSAGVSNRKSVHLHVVKSL